MIEFGSVAGGPGRYVVLFQICDYHLLQSVVVIDNDDVTGVYGHDSLSRDASAPVLR
jgi:hypothetical protein